MATSTHSYERALGTRYAHANNIGLSVSLCKLLCWEIERETECVCVWCSGVRSEFPSSICLYAHAVMSGLSHTVPCFRSVVHKYTDVRLSLPSPSTRRRTRVNSYTSTASKIQTRPHTTHTQKHGCDGWHTGVETPIHSWRACGAGYIRR